MCLFLLYGLSLIVGILVGGTGVGGILLPPALIFFSDIGTHAAMGTALASWLPMNSLGCWVYHRSGHLIWRKAIPLATGGAVTPGLAAFCNTGLSPDFLNLLLALLILFAAFCTFRPLQPGNRQNSFWLSPAGLFLLGSIVGIVGGVTGSGGPLLAIAWMVTVGMPPLTAVGISMPYSVLTAISGTVGNWLNGNIDIPLACGIGLLETAGFIAGAALVRHMPMLWVRRCIGSVSMFLGIFLLLRSI